MKRQFDPKEIPWDTLWAEAMKEASAKNKKYEWDSFAKRYSEWVKKDDYPDQLLKKVRIRPGWTVLDIGCGTGAVTIPLAKKARHVTALDMSDVMLKYLKKSLKEEGISNVDTINRSWEDVDIVRDEIPRHDVVVASRSLLMLDIRQALSNIDAVAKKAVYLTWRGNERIFDRKIYEAIDRVYHEYPDYLYIYNILYQMGIFANLDFFEAKSRICYLSIEDALDHWRWKVGDLDKKEEKKLEKFLKTALVRSKEGTLEAPGIQSLWAVISWKKRT